MFSDGGIQIELKDFQPVHERCEGCNRTVNDKELGFVRCEAYINPTYWWTGGKYCPLAVREVLSVQDVVKMAIEKGVITKDSGLFTYNNQRFSGIKSLMGLFRRNQNLYADLKRSVGIIDTVKEEGKTRVGQQKGKKHRRF